MSKHMEIRNKVFERLKTVKGDGSWSDAIEKLLNKCGIAPVHETAKLSELTQASHRPIKESVPA